MTFQLKVTKTALAGKGPGIHIAGPYVTPSVHDAITSVMNSSNLYDPQYKARTAVSAFFQGGSGNREGQFIFLELCITHDPEAIQNFEDVINQAVRGVLPEALTEIHINPNTEGAYYFFTEIAKETSCSYNGGTWGQPMAFKPENNEQWWKVYNLCKVMGLNIASPVF